MNLKEMRFDKHGLPEFAEYLQEIQNEIGFKVSSRGWCYILEQNGLITKDDFGKIAHVINKARKRGYLPIDFVAEESARAFKNVENPTEVSVVKDFGKWLSASLNAANHYTPDWWDGEEYYIQMVVEKIDLVTLFAPICRKYHIPIANSKGWSSILQRAEYAKRFAKAQDMGLECILLYCGDYDPDGLRISDFLKKNLYDLKDIKWNDGTPGFDPTELTIERFGLNYDFIEENNLSWIDNLITGSGKNLASPQHHNYKMPYVQEYIRTVGARKCEANAIVVKPDSARVLVKETIEGYLGPNALDRFKEKRHKVKNELDEFLEDTGIGDAIDASLEIINNHE